MPALYAAGRGGIDLSDVLLPCGEVGLAVLVAVGDREGAGARITELAGPQRVAELLECVVEPDREGVLVDADRVVVRAERIGRSGNVPTSSM